MVWDGVVTKPPLGLKPKWIHDEIRMNEIAGAINRYNAVGKEVPIEWWQEYTCLKISVVADTIMWRKTIMESYGV